MMVLFWGALLAVVYMLFKGEISGRAPLKRPAAP